jgi:hypothetical protein
VLQIGGEQWFHKESTVDFDRTYSVLPADISVELRAELLDAARHIIEHFFR